MPVHLILQVIAFVLLLIAGFLTWPRNPPYPYGEPLAYFGLAAFALSFITP